MKNFYMVAGVSIIGAAHIVVTMRDGTEYTIVGEALVDEYLNWYNAEYKKWKKR